MDNTIYLNEHSDKSINNWNLSTSVSAVSPIKSQEIFINRINWNKADGLSHSEILWLYSLGAQLKIYQNLIINKENIEQIDYIKKELESNFKAFLVLQTSENNKYLYNLKFSHSYDHCVAIRIRYLCALLAMNYENGNLIKEIIYNDLKWFEQVDTIPINNHGMMVCISILHAHVLLGGDINHSLVEKALRILKEIIDTIVPDNFYAKENTIAYHNFYISSLKSCSSFMNKYKISDDFCKFLDGIIENMEIALYKVVYPSGAIPSLGQSGQYETRYKSIPGQFLFKQQGLFVSKDLKNYFSYICGYATKIHKQIDDTSFTLRLGDTDIFIDCGLGTYDVKDTKAVVINGQRGHSGAFFKRFDYYTRGEFLLTDKISKFNCNLDIVDSEKILSSKYHEYKDYFYKIQREITISNLYNFNIKDVFESNDAFSSPVSRFILDGFKDFIIEGNKVSMNDGQYNLSISCSDSACFNILSSHDGDRTTSVAFRSLKWGEYKKINVIEITPLKNKLELNIVIEMV